MPPQHGEKGAARRLSFRRTSNSERCCLILALLWPLLLPPLRLPLRRQAEAPSLALPRQKDLRCSRLSWRSSTTPKTRQPHRRRRRRRRRARGLEAKSWIANDAPSLACLAPLLPRRRRRRRRRARESRSRMHRRSRRCRGRRKVNDIKTPPTTMTPRIQGGGRAQGDELAAEAEGVGRANEIGRAHV